MQNLYPNCVELLHQCMEVLSTLIFYLHPNQVNALLYNTKNELLYSPSHNRNSSHPSHSKNLFSHFNKYIAGRMWLTLHGATVQLGRSWAPSLLPETLQKLSGRPDTPHLRQARRGHRPRHRSSSAASWPRCSDGRSGDNNNLSMLYLLIVGV